MYVLEKVGPALKALREARGLVQAEVARRAGVSDSIPSRAESKDSKLNLQTLFRYLDAIGATLTDLDRELQGPDPLEGEISRHASRLESDPEYRQDLRRLYDDLGFNPEQEGLKEIAGILEQHREHDERITKVESRLDELEKDNNGK